MHTKQAGHVNSSNVFLIRVSSCMNPWLKLKLFKTPPFQLIELLVYGNNYLTACITVINHCLLLKLNWWHIILKTIKVVMMLIVHVHGQLFAGAKVAIRFIH